MKRTISKLDTTIDVEDIYKPYEDKGIYAVRRATGKRKHGARWEVVRTLGELTHVVLCYSNWKKADCTRYAEWSNKGCIGEFIHP